MLLAMRSTPPLSFGFIFERSWSDVVQGWLVRQGLQVTRTEHNRLVVLSVEGRRFIIGSRPNSPGVAVDLEIMKKDFKVRDVFRLGTCGAYERALKIGDLVLITDAIRGEGTSRCYQPQESFPAACDFMLSKEVSQILDKSGMRYAAGTFWTTDGRIVGQYDRKVLAQMVRNHVIGVDMESSCFFVVSKLLGLRSANLSVVSDRPLLSRKYTTYSYSDPKIEKGLHACIGAYLEHCVSSPHRPA
jgi:purine-nucleoside phosphorylase